MPKLALPLTDAQIRTAKTGPKPRYLCDGLGLFLLVEPPGAKLWRFKGTFEGKSFMMGLGRYPDVPLVEARARRDAVRQKVAAGIHPVKARKAEEALVADTFERVARDWFQEKIKGEEWTPLHRKNVITYFEKNLFPTIGARPVADLKPGEILAALEDVKARTPNTAARTLAEASCCLRWAVQHGRLASNPCRDLKGAIKYPKKQHFPAIKEPKDFGKLLAAIEGFRGNLIVRALLRLAPLFGVRPGELRTARWEQVDFEREVWSYRVTKTDVDHIVPLSRQALVILRGLHALTGHQEWVFPAIDGKGRACGENVMTAALKTIGYSGDVHTGHGFRASFRTIGAEVLGLPVDLLERQLAHSVKTPLGRTYDRAEFLPQRREMMQRWADFCDEARAAAVKETAPAS